MREYRISVRAVTLRLLLLHSIYNTTFSRWAIRDLRCLQIDEMDARREIDRMIDDGLLHVLVETYEGKEWIMHIFQSPELFREAVPLTDKGEQERCRRDFATAIRDWHAIMDHKR